jgi:TonB family protein
VPSSTSSNGVGIAAGSGSKSHSVGKDVKPPKVLYAPDPSSTDAALRAGYGGTVVLLLTVDVDGSAKQVRVQQGIGMGLDEQAIETVSKWRFRPATKDGQPVPVVINVEVNFNANASTDPPLYSPREANATPPQFPGADLTTYPLVVHIEKPAAVPVGKSYEIKARATIDGTGSSQALAIFCSGSKSHCSFLGAGSYPGRWLTGNKQVELMGLEKGGEKWEKSEYSVVSSPQLTNP